MRRPPPHHRPRLHLGRAVGLTLPPLRLLDRRRQHRPLQPGGLPDGRPVGHPLRPARGRAVFRHHPLFQPGQYQGALAGLGPLHDLPGLGPLFPDRLPGQLPDGQSAQGPGRAAPGRRRSWRSRSGWQRPAGFPAQLAHEIRNPLAAISGSVQVLKSDIALDDEQRKLMDIVVKESQRVSQSIEQFLDLASPGRQVFYWINLSEILEETLDDAQGERRAQRPVPARREFPGRPRSSTTATPNQFKQVFWNLAKNALKAMPDGGTLTVDFSQDKKKAVGIRFADTGRGMTAEEQRAPLRAVLLPVRERPRAGPGRRPPHRRRLRRPDRGPVGGREGARRSS